MKKLYTLCCLLLAGIPPGFAQQKDTRHDAGKVPLGLNVGTNFTTLAEVDMGPSLNVGYRFSKLIGLELEGTLYVHDNSETFDKERGYRILPQVQFFLPGRHGAYHYFFGVQTGYKHAVVYEGWIETKPGVDNDTYQQLGYYRRAKNSWQLAGRFGGQYTLGPGRRLLLEWAVGMGFKYRTFDYLDPLPPGAHSLVFIQDKENGNYYSQNEHLQVTVPVTFKVAYRF